MLTYPSHSATHRPRNGLPTSYSPQPELARRWRLSERTVEKRRCTGKGPAHLKLSGRVVYRLKDVVAYEAGQRRTGAAA